MIFLQGKLNGARYIAHGVQLPWLAKFPEISPIEHIWDMMKRELILSAEPATTIAELRKLMQDAWKNLSQDDIWHLYDHLHARIHTMLPPEGGIDVTI